jgi:hypothetical protein
MSGIIGNNIVRNGLVLNLDAADRKSYPGSGATWFDRSGSKNNGTLTNAPIYSSSNGGIITFDGVDDYVNLGNPSTLTNLNSSNITIMAAVKPSLRSYGTISIFTARGGGSNELDFGYNNSNYYFRFDRYPPSAGSAISTTLYSTYNSWNIIGASATAGNNVIFFNNGATETVSHTEIYSGDTPNIVSIGAQYQGSSWERFFLGDIAFLYVYNRALSVNEMQQNYNALRKRFNI